MTCKSLFLTSFAIPLLLLSTHVIADEQTNARSLLIHVRDLEVTNPESPMPVEKVVRSITITGKEGEPSCSNFGHKFIGEGEKKIGVYDSAINVNPGKIVEHRKGEVVTKTVEMNFKFLKFKIQKFGTPEAHATSYTVGVEKTLTLGKTERFPWGEVENKFVELTVSEKEK
ncbi:MAG: hypothetical protein JKY95_19500 [Planctomycetaceae bacterium]|nr:hypothetical protein [Planctomycetaceae bacterium]